MTGTGMLIIWILVFFGIFYFLAVRPQRRQRQAHQEMIAMLKKGDEIVTIGGLFGVVRRLGDDWVELDVSKGTRVRFLKKAISQIVSEEEDEDEAYEDEIDVVADEAEPEELVEAEEFVEAEEEPLVEAEAASDEAVAEAGPETETERPA